MSVTTASGGRSLGAALDSAAKYLGFFVVAVGVIVLMGWTFRVPRFTTFVQGWPQMVVLTAVAVVLCGFSLAGIGSKSLALHRLARGAALLVLTVSILRVVKFDLLRRWHLDSLGFAAFVSDAEMAPFTAFCLGLVAVSFLLVRLPGTVLLVNGLSLLVLLVSGLVCSWYLYGGQALVSQAVIALPTTICLTLLAIGTFCLRPEQGLTALLTEESAGGTLARRLLLPVVIIPFGVGWLRLKAQQAGWFGEEAGLSLFALSNVTLFGALMLVTARMLSSSERKKNRALESRSRLAAIVQSSDDAIISKSLEGIITSWNPAAERLFGYARNDVIGKPLLMLFPPERIEEEREILSRISRGETVDHFETVRVKKNGERCDISATISPIRDEHGKVIGASKIARDITERKLAMENLRRSEEKFRQLAENINEVFWITDPTKHQMLYVSPAYERIWGRNCESLYAAPLTWSDAIHPDDRERVLAAATDQQIEGTYDIEYRILRPDKAIRWIHDRAFPIRDEQGTVIRVVGTAEDITQRKKLEEQFRQAQKMEGIGQLAGGVAHDFNNMLAVIQMQAELLKMGIASSPAEAADEITATVERAAALTRQLLLFSRQQVFQPKHIDLSESVANTTRMLKRILGETIDMQLRLASQPMLVNADPGMLDQVLLNLAVNARDAMPDGGHLIVETAGVEFDELAVQQSTQNRPGSFVRLSVSDTGTGIPPEVLPKIFEPFFTTKGVGKGTGLGLATVFGIVQQHLGWINVYSELGRGTTFRVYLPRLPVSDREEPASEGPASLPFGSETLLLVEDDGSLRTSIRNALCRLGYRVLEAPTGRKAIDVWHANKAQIKLVLTDLVMPDGMTGKELGERLIAENPRLNIVYMSGYSAEIIGKDFTLHEGVNFLTKPFPASKLAQTIRRNLHGKE